MVYLTTSISIQVLNRPRNQPAIAILNATFPLVSQIFKTKSWLPSNVPDIARRFEIKREEDREGEKRGGGGERERERGREREADRDKRKRDRT